MIAALACAFQSNISRATEIESQLLRKISNLSNNLDSYNESHETQQNQIEFIFSVLSDNELLLSLRHHKSTLDNAYFFSEEISAHDTSENHQDLEISKDAKIQQQNYQHWLTAIEMLEMPDLGLENISEKFPDLIRRILQLEGRSSAQYISLIYDACDLMTKVREHLDSGKATKGFKREFDKFIVSSQTMNIFLNQIISASKDADTNLRMSLGRSSKEGLPNEVFDRVDTSFWLDILAYRPSINDYLQAAIRSSLHDGESALVPFARREKLNAYAMALAAVAAQFVILRWHLLKPVPTAMAGFFAFSYVLICIQQSHSSDELLLAKEKEKWIKSLDILFQEQFSLHQNHLRTFTLNQLQAAMHSKSDEDKHSLQSWLMQSLWLDAVQKTLNDQDSSLRVDHRILRLRETMDQCQRALESTQNESK